jgi:hypothetical protein
MKFLLLFLTLIFAGWFPVAAEEAKPPPSFFIRLDDVQGLFGGQSLVVATDGHHYPRQVKPGKTSGMTDFRYHLKLTDEQVKELQALIRTGGIESYQENKRAGVPDEARPRITITQSGMKRIDVEKWVNTKDPQFDALYLRLLEWVDAAARTTPYRKKEYNARASFP